MAITDTYKLLSDEELVAKYHSGDEKAADYLIEKYKNLVNNYTFDIVFHATDNLEELKNCLEVIREYINQIKLNEDNTIIQGRVLKYKKSLGGKNE